MKLTFLEQVEDPELRSEIRKVLLALEQLSEVSAAKLDKGSKASEEPIGPPGFQAPDESLSLYEFFCRRFRKARTNKERWSLVYEAEQAHRARVVVLDEDESVRMKAGTLHALSPDAEALKVHVLAQYEGWHIERVHHRLSLSKGWIEKIRMEDSRDVEWGAPLKINWRLSTNEEKRNLIRDLAVTGRTQQDVAQNLGLSVRTVSAHWPTKIPA